MNDLATMASKPNNPKAKECWAALHAWISDFVEPVEACRAEDDVVDAILHAEIEGRPVTDEEILGLILLLSLAGSRPPRAPSDTS